MLRYFILIPLVPPVALLIALAAVLDGAVRLP